MENRELPFVRDMFEKIAPRYDLLNRMLSLRQDVIWRRRMVSAMTVPERGRVVDVACGTGDVIMEIRRQKGPGVKVTGIDFSPGMLSLAKGKVRRKDGRNIALLVGDALALPIHKATIDAVTIAFGIRNIHDKAGALRGFHEVLVPGGMVLVLELAAPRRTCLRDAYMAYFQKLLPLIGRFFSRHRFAYTYLPESVSRFPSADRFMDIMALAGFSRVSRCRLTLGVANLFIGIKPFGVDGPQGPRR